MNPDGKIPAHFDDLPHLQRELCRVTLASVGDAVITTDRDGRVTFLTPIAQSLTGWTQEQAAGQPLEKLFRTIDEESRQPVESPTLRALREGVIVEISNHSLLIAKDGVERLIENSAAPMRTEQGEVAGVVLVFRDITERRRMERAFDKALAYADDIITTLREPFVVLDHDLRIKTANRSFYKEFHVTKEDTENRLVYDLGNGQWDIPGLRMLLDGVLSHNHPVQDYEVEHDFLILGRKIMLLDARPFPPDSKNPELILLAIEDVTERRRADAALLESEIRYRRLFETAKDGILILDTHTGRITDANPYMSSLLSYSHDHFLGKELWEIGLFGDKPATEAAVRELQAKGYIRYEHLPLETSSGVQVEVEVVANTYQEDRHSVIQCNIRDITERSRLEKHAQDQATALADLHRRKDEFLAMLSHELRNPLAPISNAVQLLSLQKNEDQLQQQARTIIERQVGQLTRLVDDLLEVSRITTGRIHLHQARLALNDVVAHAIETVRPLIGQRRHSLTTSLSPQPIWLNGDAARLEQAFVNLLNNAAKYTEEGGHIWLSVQREGDEAVLRVRDSGVGIAPDLLPRVFDLFTQAERSLDRAQGGLGIGLSLVQQLVKLHHGRVEAQSALGEGSEFIVRLPVAPTPSPSPVPPIEAPARTAPPLRVLLVDDNVDLATTMGMLLGRFGHDVRMVHDGLAALQAALDYRPQVVLLDLGLPRLNGFEVAKRLRQQPGLENVMLVAMTGYGKESDQELSQDAGFDHHLVKPANFGTLQEILATVSATTINRSQSGSDDLR